LASDAFCHSRGMHWIAASIFVAKISNLPQMRNAFPLEKHSSFFHARTKNS
jgi:hypothetical protein